ncbi:MAG TPA: type VII secretion-associated protein [Pseudonocardiaceae bacterium]|jgi:type VII secretion-associated protein (TIGR03931 family)|nr:type VII secretion-associated protein [Pseudonocardiaceae bacterium]
MNLRVAVDFGTSSTCVAVSIDGREPQVVVVDGAPLVPSAVFAAADGTLFVGQEAERQAAIDPSRYEPNPKRRIDEGDLLLGNTVISVLDVVRAVLTRAVDEARRLAANAKVDLLVLTHPADWGALRTRVLRQAAHGLATDIALVPEPVAAAVFHAASHALPVGAALAVLDLGGGTIDVSVVRRDPDTEPPRGPNSGPTSAAPNSGPIQGLRQPGGSFGPGSTARGTGSNPRLTPNGPTTPVGLGANRPYPPGPTTPTGNRGPNATGPNATGPNAIGPNATGPTTPTGPATPPGGPTKPFNGPGGPVPAGQAGIDAGGFRVLATHGDPNFGGADIDQLLLEHVGAAAAKADPDAWRQLVEGREMADRRRRRVLRQDVRGAKETLSRHPYTDVPLPPPFLDAHVTRDDLERLIADPLRRAATLTVDTVTDAGLKLPVAPDAAPGPRLDAVFLVGGSSRIPLVARLVHERTGIMPTTLDQPETVVARGALRAVTLDPMRTGGLPDAVRSAGSRPDRPALNAVGPTQRLTTRPGGQTRPPGRAPQSGPGQPGPGQQSRPGPGQQSQSGPGQRSGPFPAQPFGEQPPNGDQPAKKGKKRWPLWGGAGVLVVALAVVGTVIITRSGGQAAGAPAPAATTAATGPGRQIAQYEYQFPLPANWTQAGGDAGKLEVEVTPVGATSGSQAIFVAETRLGYDSTADRGRAIGELQPQVQHAGYLDFDARAQYAGRPVAYYQEPGNGVTVDWYVLFQGKVQVSIGCRYPAGGRAAVQGACQQVVAGMAISG